MFEAVSGSTVAVSFALTPAYCVPAVIDTYLYVLSPTVTSVVLFILPAIPSALSTFIVMFSTGIPFDISNVAVLEEIS